MPTQTAQPNLIARLPPGDRSPQDPNDSIDNIVVKAHHVQVQNYPTRDQGTQQQQSNASFKSGRINQKALLSVPKIVNKNLILIQSDVTTPKMEDRRYSSVTNQTLPYTIRSMNQTVGSLEEQTDLKPSSGAILNQPRLQSLYNQSSQNVSPQIQPFLNQLKLQVPLIIEGGTQSLPRKVYQPKRDFTQENSIKKVTTSNYYNTAKATPTNALKPIKEEEPLTINASRSPQPGVLLSPDQQNKVNTGVGTTGGRQVIINIRISNHGLHPSQKKHSMINLKGQMKDIYEIDAQRGTLFNVRQSSQEGDPLKEESIYIPGRLNNDSQLSNQDKSFISEQTNKQNFARFKRASFFKPSQSPSPRHKLAQKQSHLESGGYDMPELTPTSNGVHKQSSKSMHLQPQKLGSSASTQMSKNQFKMLLTSGAFPDLPHQGASYYHPQNKLDLSLVASQNLLQQRPTQRKGPLIKGGDALRQSEQVSPRQMQQYYEFQNQVNQFQLPLTDNRKMVPHKNMVMSKNMRWGSDNPYFRLTQFDQHHT
ncbi:hypothetical protein FGO68_gene349 [Halteria grandinella]|uniref:Uncharacterized protein n=1 Tax=Halteria grandinella TaxID=5974 RepID=A0A8J8NGC8_HALGN|nr:hypothetical protein FGO68_gene349 [Halteria grandinella]